MLINLGPSRLKFYFFIVLHCLAVLSVLLISDFGMVGSLLKIIAISLVAFNFKQYFLRRNEITRLHLKIDDQVDLRIGNQSHSDLQLYSDSYISDIFMQLIFSDDETGACHSISIFPDSIDDLMHSQLRSRLKLMG